MQQQQGYFIDFARQHSHFKQWKYEDMIQGNSGDVEAYLGLKLSDTFETENAFQHVKRAAGSGDWRHWFTEMDVAFFAPLLNEYLEAFGYPLEWQLSSNPVIDPEHATGYVIRTVKRKSNE
jgi:hypothetical protein